MKDEKTYTVTVILPSVYVECYLRVRERERRAPRREPKKRDKAIVTIFFYSFLDLGLKTKSEIFKLTSQQIAAFTTVLKVWQSAHPQCVHILAYNLDHYQHLCVLMNSKWPFCCGRQVWDRTAKSLLIFNPTSWFSGSSTEVCLKRFVWMFRAHYQRWNT